MRRQLNLLAWAKQQGADSTAGPAARIVCSAGAAALIDLWGFFNGWRLLLR